jgi:hypothetical protein
VIFLHDCLPFNERMAERVRRWDETEDEATRDFWTGDVWKVVTALKKYRPDLKVFYLDCGPAGLVACLNLARQSTTLWDNYAEIVAHFERLDLADFGFQALWAEFPTLDSRKLIEAPSNMRAAFGDPWSPAEVT